ncbi:CvpA family protein [Candidatus Methylopumilus turicensis]|jgi:membrane protein required for colicin V production|uniref:Colicin V production protein n=1 Tax=Candidatus Methylopumilus turicensis TaxID=1581680 RepID=A0A0B7J027_9PROT|nr:CvpA family protein [Candidatus Methylopumilus turicensis]CEN56023.1 Colicin V production protein [Candidatus Methylopumilus turicensis]
MTIFDYVVLAIVGLSIFFSVMRGFVREALALIGWVAAFFVAKTYTLELAPLLPKAIPTETLQYLAGFIILFLATLLVSSLLAIALSQVFEKVGLSWLDRGLGAVFGTLRGVMIVGVMVFLSGLTDLPKDTAWRSAMFSAPLEAMVLSAMPWMPKAIADRVKFDS